MLQVWEVREFYFVLIQLGMGVVTVSTSGSRSPLGSSTRFSTYQYTLKRPLIIAFKTDKTKNTALVAPHEPIPLPIEAPKDQQKRVKRATKSSKRVKAVSVDEVSSCSLELDYNEAAAILEHIYKHSPAVDVNETANVEIIEKRARRMNRKIGVKEEKEKSEKVVRSRRKKVNRLSLDMRIELRRNKEHEVVSMKSKREDYKGDNENIERLVREYSASTDLVSLDWKKMKIPPVLPSSEHTCLFKLMQPMKALIMVKENLREELDREPTDSELAEATDMTAVQVRKRLEVGRAARNKLIKVTTVLYYSLYYNSFS